MLTRILGFLWHLLIYDGRTSTIVRDSDNIEKFKQKVDDCKLRFANNGYEICGYKEWIDEFTTRSYDNNGILTLTTNERLNAKIWFRKERN